MPGKDRECSAVGFPISITSLPRCLSAGLFSLPLGMSLYRPVFLFVSNLGMEISQSFAYTRLAVLLKLARTLFGSSSLKLWRWTFFFLAFCNLQHDFYWPLSANNQKCKLDKSITPLSPWALVAFSILLWRIGVSGLIRAKNPTKTQERKSNFSLLKNGIMSLHCHSLSPSWKTSLFRL